MNKYKFKFSSLVVALMILGVLVAVACLVLNVYRFLSLLSGDYQPTIYNYMSFFIIIILSIGFIIIALSAYFNSYYQVKDKIVILKFGIISNKINLDEIKEVRLITGKNKLELVYKDDSYFSVITKPEWFESFVDEIKNASNKIAFVQNSEPIDKAQK